MVDPEENLSATQSAYVIPALATPSLSAASPDPLGNRMGVLEKALHLVLGIDH